MKFTFRVSPNYRDSISTGRIMRELTIGLLVIYAFALYYYFTSYGTSYGIHAVLLMVTSLSVAFATEIAWALFLKKDLSSFLKGSYPWVTAIILTLMVPITMTYYALGIGTLFALLFGKLLFGGFGQNVFNPAAVGRAIILASFAGAAAADITTSATPTTAMEQVGWMITKPELATKFLAQFGGLGNLLVGFYPGSLGETSKILILVVGVVLALRHVLDWKVPAIYIGSVFVFASMIAVIKGMGAWYPIFHLATGGLMFGAFFMATDPVTNPTSASGRVIFALGCAILTVLIRVKANLPEGVLYSILIMNMLTPMIERLTEGWQIKLTKKYTIAFVSLFLVGSLSIGATTFAMSYKAPAEEAKPTVTLGVPVLIFGDDTALSPAEVTSSVAAGDVVTITVSSKGYAVLESEYDENPKPNILIVKIDTVKKTIVSVAFSEFHDTKNIGDKTNSTTYLDQFTGLSITDPTASVDTVTGATFSSVSVARAVRAAIDSVVGK